MSTVSIKAEPRVAGTKGHARRLRMQGKTPAVVYGYDLESFPIALDTHSFGLLLHRDTSGNRILDLEVEGREGPDLKVLIKHVQRHPVDESLVHVDLLRVDMERKVRVQVPVHLTGAAESPGVREGGIVEHLLRHLAVECLPGSIPEDVVVDVSGLAAGESVHVRDIEIPGAHALDSPDTVVVMVEAKSKAKDEEEGAPGAAEAAPGAAPAATEGAS